jgi:hypothetical protein
MRNKKLNSSQHKIGSDPTKTTAIGLIRYAQDFFNCALAADETIGIQEGYEIIAPIPVLYLIAHSIELCLKAYLIHKNVPLHDLKKYGHDLKKSLQKAKELGLYSHIQLNKIELGALCALNDLYSTKQLNYIITGSKQFPIFGHLQSTCENLLNTICPLVGFQKIFYNNQSIIQ